MSATVLEFPQSRVKREAEEKPPAETREDHVAELGEICLRTGESYRIAGLLQEMTGMDRGVARAVARVISRYLLTGEGPSKAQ